MKYYHFLILKQNYIKIYFIFLFLIESIIRYSFELNVIGLNKLIIIYGFIALIYMSLRKNLSFYYQVLLSYFIYLSLNSLYHAGSNFTLSMLFSDETGVFTFFFSAMLIHKYNKYLSISILHKLLLLFFGIFFYLLIDKNILVIFSIDSKGDYQTIGNYFILLFFMYNLVINKVSFLYILNTVLFIAAAQFIGSNAATVIVLAFFIIKIFTIKSISSFFMFTFVFVVFSIFLLVYFDLWMFLKIFNYGESFVSTSFTNRINDYKNFYNFYTGSFFGNIIVDVFMNRPGAYPHSSILTSITHSGIFGFIFLSLIIIYICNDISVVKNNDFYKISLLLILLYSFFATFFLWPVLIFFISYGANIVISDNKNNK